MKRPLAVAFALAVVGLTAAYASGASKTAKFLGGYVQVVAYPDGAGGISCTERGQPTMPLETLIETPALSALLGRQPRGLVVVDATLHPITAS